MTQTLAEVESLRAKLWDAGYRPIAILNPEHPDPLRAGKAPLADRWTETARTDPPEAVRIPPVPFALNTGILCDGLRAIDFDIDDVDMARRCRGLAAEMLGEAPIRTRRNSARFLALYRAVTGAPPKVTLTGAGHAPKDGQSRKIEVLGRGQQFVAFGRHASGAPLEWFPDAPGAELLSALPAVTETAVHAFLDAAAAIIGADKPKAPNGHDAPHTAGEAQADPLRVATALNAIPNDGAADWESWNRIGMAIWRATGASDMGRVAWHAWSQRNSSYDPAHTEERWHHYTRSPPKEIGAGTLFHLARGTYTPPRHQEAPPEDPAGYWDSIDSQAADAAIPPPAEEDETDHPPFIATPISAAELADIPPRQWVYGHFLIRRFISVLGAPGGVGKTAYAYPISLAVVTGLELLKEKVHESGNAWIYNLEDPREELLRRMKAALLHHDIDYALIQDRLFLDSGRDRPLVIAKSTRDGGMIASPVIPALIAEIKRRNVRLLVIDPFVRSHRLEENVNEQIDFAAALWGQVADKGDCSVLLLHHFRKGAVGGDAASFRGASALIDAARAAISLSPMGEDDASKVGVQPDDRWRYVRADNAKLNLAPPPEHTVWLRLSGVDLENARDGRESDRVQTVERWEPPSPWANMGMSVVVQILDRIQAGPEHGEQYTLTRGGKSTRWAGVVVMEIAAKTDKQAGAILRAWVANGVLLSGRYHSPAQRKERDGVQVDPAKMAEIRQSGGSLPPDDEA